MRVAQPLMPYSAGLISILLRKMPADRLAAVQPHDFQRHPAPKIEKGALIQELITNERAGRR